MFFHFSSLIQAFNYLLEN